MPGVKGRSGSPGKPKSEEHKAAIRESVQAFWNSPEGLALRASAKEAARQRRLAKRREAMNDGR